MTRWRVGIARCEHYERTEVSAALDMAITRAGGMPAVQPVPQTTDQAVLIKANLLSPTSPERAVTTHPEILRALISQIRAAFTDDALPIYVGDNPGYIFTDPADLIRRTGVDELAAIPGVEVGTLLDRGVRDVERSDFKTLTDARISSRYLDAPYRVNAAKLKTHVETEMTGCIKNIFGTADIDTRKKSHRSTSQRHLVDAIVDLFTIAPPNFNVLDAVVAMEGDGPSHGMPRHAGWIVASENALAADMVACAIMGYSTPTAIPLIRAAAERGIGPASRDEIDLIGADWGEIPVKNFKKSSGALRLLPTFLRGLAHSLVAVYPDFFEKTCVHCGICARVCPVAAIEMKSGVPEIDKARCVRCMCCHEMCPNGSMRAGKNFIATLAERIKVR